MTEEKKKTGGLYWDKPEKWRDEDVPEDQWEDFIKGIKQMSLNEDLVDKTNEFGVGGGTLAQENERLKQADLKIWQSQMDEEDIRHMPESDSPRFSDTEK